MAFDNDGRLLGVRGEMLHDEGAYTPQGISHPTTRRPHCRPVHIAGLSARRAGDRDQQGRHHAGAGRGLSGRCICDGTVARPRRRRARSRARRVRRRNLVPGEDAVLSPLKTVPARRSPSSGGCGLPAHGARSDRLRGLRSPAARAPRRPLSRPRRRQRRERHGSRPVRIRHRAHRPLRTHFRHRGGAHGARIKTALAQICAEQFGVAPDSVAVAAGDRRRHSLRPRTASPADRR